MAATVRLYGAFSEFAGGVKRAQVDGATVAEALETLVRAHPSLRERLRDERGRFRRHLNVYLNEDDLRDVGGDGAPVREGDVIHLIPAVSGGR